MQSRAIEGIAMPKQSFLQGAVVMAAAGVATKAMAMTIQIVIARQLGAQGFGLFQTINPLFFFLLTISTFALPPALSKVIAENLALGRYGKARRAWRIANVTVLILSTSVCIAALAIAPDIGRHWLDPRAIPAFIGAMFRIPVVCLSSVMAGYYMGIQNQTPPAAAWVVETAVRTAATIPLVIWLNHYGIAYGALGIMMGAGLGETAGYLFMLWKYIRRDRYALTPRDGRLPSSTVGKADGVVRDLAAVAAPTTMTNVIGIVAFAAEPAVMYAAFAASGIAKTSATTLYGAFAMAMELLFLPTVLSSAISSVVIPAVSEAAALRDERLVTRRLNQAVQATAFIAFPAMMFFMLAGHDAALTIYRDHLAGDLLAYLAPTCAFLYVLDPLSAVLQGLNKAAVSTFISVVTSSIRIAGIYYFVAIAHDGIYGVATAVAISGIVSCMLSILCVRRYVTLWINFTNIGKMLIAAAAASIPIHEIQHAFRFATPWLQVACSGIVGILVYFIVAVYLRIARPEQLVKIPFIGPLLAYAMGRMPFLT